MPRFVVDQLGQVGGGHFSPIAGYNAKRDMVLVLDVVSGSISSPGALARF